MFLSWCAAAVSSSIKLGARSNEANLTVGGRPVRLIYGMKKKSAGLKNINATLVSPGIILI